MMYRIRFRREPQTGDAEAVVEANSPTEAMVKFRCTRPESVTSGGEQQVISVLPDQSETGHW